MSQDLPSIGEVIGKFLTGKRTLLSTKVVIGLVGEFMGSFDGEEAHLHTSECVIGTEQDKQKVLDKLAIHGGCDTTLLEGILEMTDGRLKITATEPD